MPSIFFEILIKVAGPFFFMALQYSSIATAMRIKSEKAVGKLSLFPFASLFVNSVIWTFYGLLKNDRTVLLPNISGALAGFYCCVVYVSCATNLNLSLISGCILLLMVAVYWFWKHDVATLGTFGCVLAVILMGSPLASLMTVIREKSTDAMPFNTSLMTWLNALSWSLYGILVAEDKMIYGPNLLGLVLGSIQLALFVLFPSKPKLVAILKT